MLSSPSQFEAALRDAWPIANWSNMTIVVACSGGADSTALTRALVAIKSSSTTIKVAHFNHQLRGSHSDADEAFVVQLAQTFDCECRIQRADRDLPSTTHLSKSSLETDANSSLVSEDRLRAMRYRFLECYANEVGARYIVTAHTADDQAETVLHRLCRGAGLQGLSGIQRLRSIGTDLMLVRPMLSIWRHDVIEYLKLIRQPFCNDASNNGLEYTRNRIRNEILPLLAEHVHPQAKKNLVESASVAGEVLEYFAGEANKVVEMLVRFELDRVRIANHCFKDFGATLCKEVMRQIWIHKNWPMKDMTHEHWEKLYRVATSDQEIHETDFPGRIRVEKKAEHIELFRFD